MKSVPVLILLLCLLGCKSPEPRPPVTVKTGSFIEESAKRNKALNKKEQLEIEALIKSFPDKNYLASENGFWYTYNNRVTDNLPTPKFGDKIEYNYNITKLDGTIIYSKSEIGLQTYYMDKEELFSGLREGLKLMKPSEDVTFIFPSQKAFGYYGDNRKIGTNVPLICNVIIKTITTNND